MEKIYTKAYKEVFEILKYLTEESLKKIPKEMLEMFEKKMDTDYKFKVDMNKSFEEQNLLDETKAILANIFRDYWATPYQRERIEAKEKYDRQKIEEEKKSKYNPDEIFNKRKNEKEFINNQTQQEINNLPIEIKKERFYQKIIKFFQKIFHVEGE